MIIKRVHGSVGEMKKEEEKEIKKKIMDVQEGEQETPRRITEVYNCTFQPYMELRN